MSNIKQEPGTFEPKPGNIDEKSEHFEEKRLRALYKYEILHTPSEQEFDRIAELAAEACEAPIALITFIDRHTQWVKAQVGIGDGNMKREESFCQYILHIEGEIMEVEDARQNRLFKNLPIVKEGPMVRFYAGSPLIDLEGHVLGSICIIDHHPRQLKRKEKFILKSLADQIVKELEKRLAFQDLFQKHREVHQSLNYAQKIQNAILQPAEEASSRAPSYFTLFRPIGQVSGDFYWAKEHQEHLYLAAVDCTGHGIPGAFLSMLGISLLNDILIDKEEAPLPGEILDQLRTRILRELKGGNPKCGMNDGMDASLIKIPLEKEEGEPIRVQFAGAHNSLYVIRDRIALEKNWLLDDPAEEHDEKISPFTHSSNGIMVKGDPQPVGYFKDAKESFSSVHLKLEPGDML
jgi:hypothetical protein